MKNTGSLEKQSFLGLKQGTYKVSIEEVDCTKTDRDLSKGHENRLKGAPIG